MSPGPAAAGNAYRRKKQPEVVRRALLDAAAQMACRQGLAAITVQGVADAAGVTKGGLLHHFPSKRALVEAVYQDLRDQFDRRIDACMAGDPEPYGRFTRAYVNTTFAELASADSCALGPASASLLLDPGMRRWWVAWLEQRLAQHQDTDAGEMLEIVRSAADGIWFSHMLQVRAARGDIRALHPRLVAMTRGAGAP